MHIKKQLFRMQEFCCILVIIPPDIAIDQWNLTVSHPTFPSGHCIFYVMASYSYATLPRGITVEYSTCRLYFLGIHTRLKYTTQKALHN